MNKYELSHGTHADIALGEVDYILSTLRNEEKRDVMARAMLTVVETVHLDVGLGIAIIIQAIVAYAMALHKYAGVPAMCAFLQCRSNPSSANLHSSAPDALAEKSRARFGFLHNLRVRFHGIRRESEHRSRCDHRKRVEWVHERPYGHSARYTSMQLSRMHDSLRVRTE